MNDKINELINNSLIPIVIGVTGHRDLRQEDIAELEQKVKDILGELQDKYPHSPLMLLSPLAEGADRLVAKVAVQFGATLIVPLPMPKEEYMRDFKDQASKDEFLKLLEQSVRYLELPLVVGNTLENISSPGANRDRQYTQIGVYIAQHSQILIALWDGRGSQKMAGTSAILHFKLEGMPEEYSKPHSSLSQNESGPVYHILTPRISNPIPDGLPFSIRKLYPEYWGESTHAENAYNQILSSVDRYNLDVRKRTPKVFSDIENAKKEILPGVQLNTLDPICQGLLDRYLVADAMAKKHRYLRFMTIRGLFIIVFMGFMFFQIYAHLSHRPLILMLYPTILLVCLLWYLVVKKKKYDYKHEDYRALSEAARVQFFWKISNVQENATDHYLHKHRGILQWIRYSIRVWSIPLCDAKRVKPVDYYLALTRWVEYQRDWFAHRSKADKRRLRFYDVVSSGLFVLSLSGAFALFLFVISHGNILSSIGSELENINNWIVLVIVLLLALAVTIKGYVEKTALSEQTKQYERMADLYTLAFSKLNIAMKKGNIQEIQNLLIETGKEALMENGDWLLLHRAQPLEVPIIESKPPVP